MRMTIICEDKFIEKVREKAKIISQKHLALSKPLSPTGELPATHWMCVLSVTDKGYERLKNLQEHTIMNTDKNPTTILKEMNLKTIK